MNVLRRRHTLERLDDDERGLLDESDEFARALDIALESIETKTASTQRENSDCIDAKTPMLGGNVRKPLSDRTARIQNVDRHSQKDSTHQKKQSSASSDVPSWAELPVTAEDSHAQSKQYFELGQAALRAGEFTEAADLFSMLVMFKPKCHVAFHKRACCYFRQGQHASAVRDFDHALLLAEEICSPMTHRICHDMGQAYIKMREFDQAIDCFQKAEQQIRRALENDVLVGAAEKLQKELEQVLLAQEHCRASQSIDECAEQLRNNPSTTKQHQLFQTMGEAYAAKGEHKKAAECFILSEERRSAYEHEVNKTVQFAKVGRAVSQVRSFFTRIYDYDPEANKPTEYGILDIS